MAEVKKPADKGTAKKTDIPQTIYAGLAYFQSVCPAIKKDSEAGTKFKYKYGSLPHILEQIKPHMAAAGLGFTQPILLEDKEGESREVIKTVLFHIVDDKTIESTIELPDFKFDQMNVMQSKGSIITYLRRYSLMSVLGIVAEEDDNDAQGDGKKTQRKTTQKPGAKAKDELPWLNPKEDGKVNQKWVNAVKHLAGGGTIDDVKKHYRLGKANEEKIKNEALEYTEPVVDIAPTEDAEILSTEAGDGPVSDLGPDEPNTLFDSQGNLNPESE